ncbi:MAG: hypothetical protein EHM24_13655 [Acidobacteria bacterium]|nr:MAG: hypothetical protein EHM24_13655 [Acidobacteriota bacterium]
MGDAERIWREKSDDDLLDAAAELEGFTEEGQRIIRAELKRRGLEDPGEQAGEPAPALECLRCRAELRFIDPESEGSPRWHWGGQRIPALDPDGGLAVYACPKCGHVELFMNLPVEEPPA